MLAKINAVADGEALSDIVLRVGTVRPPDAGDGPFPPPALSEQKDADVSAETRAEIAAAVQVVADPDLQTRLKTLFSKSAP